MKEEIGTITVFRALLCEVAHSGPSGQGCEKAVDTGFVIGCMVSVAARTAVLQGLDGRRKKESNKLRL